MVMRPYCPFRPSRLQLKCAMECGDHPALLPDSQGYPKKDRVHDN